MPAARNSLAAAPSLAAICTSTAAFSTMTSGGAVSEGLGLGRSQFHEARSFQFAASCAVQPDEWIGDAGPLDQDLLRLQQEVHVELEHHLRHFDERPAVGAVEHDLLDSHLAAPVGLGAFERQVPIGNAFLDLLEQSRLDELVGLPPHAHAPDGGRHEPDHADEQRAAEDSADRAACRWWGRGVTHVLRLQASGFRVGVTGSR